MFTGQQYGSIKSWKIVNRSEDPETYEMLARRRPNGYEPLKEARKARKKALLDNPGKTLAEIWTHFPPEICDANEADTRKHWDEIEL